MIKSKVIILTAGDNAKTWEDQAKISEALAGIERKSIISVTQSQIGNYRALLTVLYAEE